VLVLAKLFSCLIKYAPLVCSQKKFSVYGTQKLDTFRLVLAKLFSYLMKYAPLVCSQKKILRVRNTETGHVEAMCLIREDKRRQEIHIFSLMQEIVTLYTFSA
jgi:hypothetical protein